MNNKAVLLQAISESIDCITWEKELWCFIRNIQNLEFTKSLKTFAIPRLINLSHKAYFQKIQIKVIFKLRLKMLAYINEIGDYIDIQVFTDK